MLSGKHDITIEKEADYADDILWSSGDPPTVVNMTGWTAQMDVRNPSDNSLIISLTTGNGRITLGSAGQIGLRISAADTTALAATNAVYDLFIISDAGHQYRLLHGVASIVANVTQL